MTSKGINVNFRSRNLPPVSFIQGDGGEPFGIVRGVLNRVMYKQPNQTYLAESWGSLFAHYDPIFTRYNRAGARILLVLNQESFGQGLDTPWDGMQSWADYITAFAEVCGLVALHYPDGVDFQIWNEQDVSETVPKEQRSSVRLEPVIWGELTRKAAAAIRSVNKTCRIYGGGFCNGAGYIASYYKQATAEGSLGVDTLALHPYGVWFDRKPLISGGWFGKALDYHTILVKTFPLPLAITEFGVAANNPFPQDQWTGIADYLKDGWDFFSGRSYQSLSFWAWSDDMRQGGAVNVNGEPKQPIHNAMLTIGNNVPVVENKLRVKIGNANARIRLMPNAMSWHVGTLPAGQTVAVDTRIEATRENIVAKQGNAARWVAVEYATGKFGFVRADLLKMEN